MQNGLVQGLKIKFSKDSYSLTKHEHLMMREILAQRKLSLQYVYRTEAEKWKLAVTGPENSWIILKKF